jgi:arabinogalactan endo-1,4-beta-galactosidase
MLWPAGKIYQPAGEDWASFIALLKSCIAGARLADVRRPPSLLIHFDRGGDNVGARRFFDNIMAAGVTSFDLIGLSYYPFWHGPLSHLQAKLNDLAHRYGKI